MTFFTIPARSDLPWYKFRINLSGVIYTVHMRYNLRMSRWVMDIKDNSDNPIVSGIPVLIQRNLTSQYGTYAIPPGLFFATDDSGAQAQPTQFSFGVDHTFYYGDPTQ